MDTHILNQQPTEYLSRVAYWDVNRFLDPPQTLPSESSDGMYRQIPAVFNQLRALDTQPQQLLDGQVIPTIQPSEGMLRLVIDELVWVKTKKVLGSVTKPQALTRMVQIGEFNAAAQKMAQTDWYTGPSVTYTKSFMHDGRVNHKQISRSVIYAAADDQHEGWFTGMGSNGLRHSGFLLKAITAVKGYQEFVYAQRVGDINALNPDDTLAYTATRGIHQVIQRSKVAAAAVYLK